MRGRKPPFCRFFLLPRKGILNETGLSKNENLANSGFFAVFGPHGGNAGTRIWRSIPRPPVTGRPHSSVARGELGPGGARHDEAESCSRNRHGRQRLAQPGSRCLRIRTRAWNIATRDISRERNRALPQWRDPGPGASPPATLWRPQRASRFPETGKRLESTGTGPRGPLTRLPDGRRNPRRAPFSPS